MIEMYKDGKKMTEEEICNWVQLTVDSSLVAVLYKAGYRVSKISEMAKIPESTVRKYMKTLKK